ncbi:uncharacterized protein LOC120636849 [Pararge aegeria]|nr:uncharacterized protein LOC120635485 isoform X1 [Pararge aegeria]XP_039764345.1 uncharacterized protein LOC120636849 [Pararge aegeria]
MVPGSDTNNVDSAYNAESQVISLDHEPLIEQNINNFELDEEQTPSIIRTPPLKKSSQQSRKRRPRYYPTEDRALKDSQAKLLEIEAKNAEATLAHAQATNNLAAAIDRLGQVTNESSSRLAAAIEKIGDMIGIFASASSKKKRRKIVLTSDSESD